MYTMWDAPSDRDYYEQFNPPYPEEEEEQDELPARIEATSETGVFGETEEEADPFAEVA